MESTEETRSYGSEGHLSRKSSESPHPSIRSSNTSKKIRTSRSSVSVQRSSLIPQKESVYSEGPSDEITEPKKQESALGCDCAPGFYNKVLGPTADETILTGLQTLIDLCGKLRVCGERDESGEEEPEREQDLPEKDTSTKLRASKIQTEQSLAAAKSQTERNIKTSKSQTDHSMVSAGFQVNPSVKSIDVQTAPYPQMVSEILQTIGLTPEMVSKVLQTSFVDMTEPQKASLMSNAMQTSIREVKSGQVQTSSSLLPTIQEQTEPPPHRDSKTQSDVVRSVSKQTLTEKSKSSTTILEPRPEKVKPEQQVKSDEHKCISPPEPPDIHCKCCKCSSSSSLRRSSKSSVDKAPCVCGSKPSTKCKCESSPERRKSGEGEHGDQQSPVEVKYAITKISKFKEFTTFEVMRSTRNQPSKMPKGIEGVFVLKKKNGDSNGEVRVKTSKRGINGSKNGGSRSSNGGKRRSSKEINGGNGSNAGNGGRSGEVRSHSQVEAN
ncbi:uncharacterized protein LOC135140796 [Zophobas morio]|uniref:uncharacterized protein LOC135140796 n=1 Tax=Zophobas morio TaxID=2755281 RepID=UPI003082BC12